MVTKHETVVVEGDREPVRNSNYGWVIAVVVILLLIVAVYLFGGFNWMSGRSSSQTTTAPSTSTSTQMTTGK